MNGTKLSSAIQALGITIVVCWILINAFKEEPPKEQPPKIKTCECLNYYQFTYWSTKRDRVLNKRKRSRTDSIELKTADRILGIGETLDNPPKR